MGKLLLFSLREKYREGGEVDFPLPLATVDAEKERQIFEKDEEVPTVSSSPLLQIL